MSEKQYTIGEEIVNSISHTVGVLFSIYAIVMLAVKSTNPMEAATTSIFGATMFILFQASACYHAVTSEKAKRVFQKIDHSAIYVLIAGTYTPILMLTVPFPASVAIMAMIWYLAVLGIVFSCISLKSKHISSGIYMIIGWMSMALVWYIWNNGGHMAVWYLLGGGLLYTLGVAFYLAKFKYSHSIWHLFVLCGVVLHYMAIMSLIKVI